MLTRARLFGVRYYCCGNTGKAGIDTQRSRTILRPHSQYENIANLLATDLMNGDSIAAQDGTYDTRTRVLRVSLRLACAT